MRRVKERETLVDISADNNTFRVTWKIKNFTSLNTKEHYSDIFIVGGCKWQLIIYPKGNNVKYLSVYLNVPDAASLPNGWSRYADFCFCIINQTNGKDTKIKDVEHVFNAQETSWGFRSFIALSDLSPKTGFMINRTIILELEVSLGDVINYSTDRGKTETVSKSEMELQAKDAKIKELEKAMMTIETAKAMVNEELKACKQELAIKDTARELEPQISNSEIEELKNEIKSLQDANQKVEEELEMGDMARFKDLEHELTIAKKDREIKELLVSLKFSEKRVQDVKEAAADWRFLTFSTSRLGGAQMLK
ncbi:hypothetical protein AMTRI_Chr03g56300 [Amborella trichopoda]